MYSMNGALIQNKQCANQSAIKSIEKKVACVSGMIQSIYGFKRESRLLSEL